MIDSPLTFTFENGQVRAHERELTHPDVCSVCHGSGYVNGGDGEPEPCDQMDCSYWAGKEIVVPTDANQAEIDQACDEAGRPQGAEDQGDPDMEWVGATIEHLKAAGLII